MKNFEIIKNLVGEYITEDKLKTLTVTQDLSLLL